MQRLGTFTANDLANSPMIRTVLLVPAMAEGFSCPLIFQPLGRWFFSSSDMSYYRDVYLKSDDWKSLRKHKLITKKNRCCLCGHTSKSNDVHHLKYKRLYDVELKDLRVMCRACHEWTHDLLEKYPKMKTLKRHKIWKQILLHKTRQDRYSRFKPSPRQMADGSKLKQFGESRKALFESGKIYRNRMPAHDWIMVIPGVAAAVKNPEKLLTEYIYHTGIDPRRTALVRAGGAK